MTKRYIAQRSSSGATVFDIERNEMFCCIPKSYVDGICDIAFGRAQDIADIFNSTRDRGCANNAPRTDK